MNVTVFGMGYVGCVTSACLAEWSSRHGVDVDSNKTALINAARVL
jgi:UDP-glucose 6-dehydrogenase